MKIDPMEPLNEDEIDELELFLQTLEGDEALLGISELDGFLTALVSGPNVIQPTRWLEAVWGGEDFAPAWESNEDAEQIIALIIRHMNSITTTLIDAPETFDPIYMENDFNGEPVLNVDDWCQGYLKGIQLDPEGWQELDEDMEQALAPILVFGMEDGLDQMVNAEDDVIEALQQEVVVAARALHAYWLELRNEASLFQ